MADKKPTRLSYSGWATWKQCPAKYKKSYIEKLPRSPIGPAGQRGLDMHDHVDKYLLKAVEDLPNEIRNFYGQWLMNLREGHVLHPELKWAVDENWEPCAWDDPACAWRGILDLKVDPSEGDDALDIFEWKTGGIYPEHEHQAELYGLIGLVLHPEKDTTKVTNVYFDKKENKTREYPRKDLEGLKVLWGNRRKSILNDTMMVENPTWKCRYCDFSKDNGGTCRF